ncbi:MAG: hypothetical protein JWO37_4095 [Acidimicrobiales bacterium]|nr:hypothetical protein [Acidimicrobiales bacterium]
MTRRVTRRGAALAAVLVLVPAMACQSGKKAAPAGEPVRIVVAGPVGAYREIAIVAGAARALIQSDAAGPLAPLLAARTVPAAEPLASYGLDPPQARVEYATTTGDRILVEIGHTDFDHHFVYVVRPPDRATVDLVPTSVLAPLLARVGIALPSA